MTCSTRPAAVLALAMACAAAPCAAADWLAWETPHFSVLSQVPEPRSREIFGRLHLYMQALPQVSNLPMRAPELPTRIFLLDEPDFARIAAGRGDIGGMFLSDAFQGHIVVNAAGRLEESLSVIQHEYVHFSIRNVGLSGIPAFYEEGLAQFVQTFTVRDRSFHWGFFPTAYRKIARSESMPLLRLLAVRVDSPDYVSEHAQEPFYARSLLVLHYCLLERRDCRDPLLRLVARLADGDAPAGAFREEFGKSPEDFDRELDRYLSRRPDRRYSTIPASTLDRQPVMVPRPLAEGEGAARLGALLLRAAPQDAGIVPMFESLRALPAWRGPALAGLALAHELQGREAEADALLGELEATDDAPAGALIDAGRLLLARTARLYTQEPRAPESQLVYTILHAREFFEAALAQEPESGEAVFGYALTQLQLPDDLERSARLVQAAHEREPSNAEIAMLHAVHVDALGDRETALRIMRTAVCGAVSPPIRAMAREQLGPIRCYRSG